MKRLLLIAYNVPPIGGSESIRSPRTIKYLSKFGWSTIVLTVKGSIEPKDDSLLSELPKDVPIYRAYSVEKKVFIYLLKNFGINLFHFPYSLDYKIGWLPFAIRKGKNILKNENIDIIVSRSTPIGSHLVALKLKSFSGVPWVADFSDPWTQNPFISYSNRFAHRLDEYIEQKVISTADKIVFTSKYAKVRLLEKYKRLHEDKVIVIPNSYDPSIFSKMKSKKTNEFTITHVGKFYGIRSPEPFLKALKLLRDEKNINVKIKVKLIGDIGDFKYLISKYGLKDIIQVIDTVPHEDILTHLFDSDVLLLIDAPSRGFNVFLPLKLIEYIRTGKPILAITSEGVSSDVVISTKTGVVVSPDDIEGIKDAIENYYELYMNSNLKVEPDWDEIEKYSAEKCTKLLVRTMEELTR